VLNLDPDLILASLLPGALGFVLFRYGRSMDRVPHIIAGLVLMIFPVFVPFVWLMLALTAVIALALVVGVKAFNLLGSSDE
jgi:hypothetical protein